MTKVGYLKEQEKIDENCFFKFLRILTSSKRLLLFRRLLGFRECGTNLKISFAIDSRINKSPKFRFFGNFKKNEQYKKRIVRFFFEISQT